MMGARHFSVSTLDLTLGVLAAWFARAPKRAPRRPVRTRDSRRDRREGDAPGVSKPLQRLFDNAVVGMVLIGPDGRFSTVNERACEITGYTREELHGLTPADLSPPEDAARNRAEQEAVLSGAVTGYERERRIVRKDGREAWVHISAALVGEEHDPGGARAVLVVIDITERKSVELERARAFELLELGDPCYVLDSGFRFALVNSPFERVMRRRRQDVLGRSIEEVFPSGANRGPGHRSELQRVMRERVPCRFEEYDAALDMWSEVRAYPMADGGIAVVVRDATTEKRAVQERERLVADLEDAVARASRSRAQLEAAFHGIAEGIAIYDMGYSEVLINPAAVAGFGDASRSFESFVHEYEVSDVAGRVLPLEEWPISRVMRGESFREWELRVRRVESAESRFICFSGEPVRDEHGTQVLAVLVTRDVTAEMRAKEERESLLTALEERDRKKDEFLAMLSHELRNPLAPIETALFLLERVSPSGPQAATARAVIGRQVHHMASIINDLLDVTRISRGKIQLRRAVVDVAALVRRAADDYRGIFAAGAVELSVDVPETPLPIQGDATRIVQVLGNLLQNAAKFTHPGGHAWIRAAREADDVVVHVEDDGIGIPQATLAHVFEPFVQDDKTLDRRKGGLGLGLALVKGIVELHGGSVAAQSSPAGGAALVVRLPMAIGAETPLAAEPHPARTEGGRVLVIEDNVDAAVTLRDVLELDHHVVELAFTGTDGVAKARSFHPDVVLCDIGLPGLDGYGVARALRSDPALSSAYLVALSGYALADDVKRALHAGFDEHMAKPPDIPSLEDVIARARQRRLAPGGGAAATPAPA